MNEEGSFWMTDGGFYTYMCMVKNLNLPNFCALPLLDSEEGTQEVMKWYDSHAEMFTKHGQRNIMFDAATWHGSKKWAALADETYVGEKLDELN